jgi:transposase-like protein
LTLVDTNSVDILPDCRTKTPTGGMMHMGIWYYPVFCASDRCGHVKGPYVPDGTTFAFWLCHDCEGKWAPIAGTMAVPDEVFFQKVADEQLETYGRHLTPHELTEVLKDDRSTLTRLSKDRK